MSARRLPRRYVCAEIAAPCATRKKTMNYLIYSMFTGEEENSTDAHVLARAYHAAWRAEFGTEPVGGHQVTGLGFVMYFGKWLPVQVGISPVQAAPTSKRVETAAESSGGCNDD